MTKADIVQIVWERISFSRKETFDLVDLVFEIILDTLADGEKVKIANFGSFEVKQKKTRKGRNPQTGETLEINARKVQKKRLPNDCFSTSCQSNLLSACLVFAG